MATFRGAVKFAEKSILRFLEAVGWKKVLTFAGLGGVEFFSPGPKGQTCEFADVHVLSGRAKIITSIPEKQTPTKIFGWGDGGQLSEQQIREMPLFFFKTRLIPKNLVISDSVKNQDNLYHFYLDDLLPFLLLKKKFSWSENFRLVFLEKPTRYQRNLLSLMQVEYVYRWRQAACSHLTVMRLSNSLVEESIADFRHSSAAKLEDSCENPRLGKFSARVYLARRHRRPDNQILLERLAKGFGYQKLFFEDLSFSDQIFLGKNTKHWLADHGAGLVHMIWGTPESLIEIVPVTAEGTSFGGGCFKNLLSEVNSSAKYHEIRGSPLVVGENRFIADLSKVKNALQSIHGLD